MAPRKTQSPLPRDYTQSWPRGPFEVPAGGTDEGCKDAEALGKIVEALQSRNAEKHGLLVPRQIERISGVSQGTVHNVWTGQTWPRVDTLIRLARAFGMQLTIRVR